MCDHKIVNLKVAVVSPIEAKISVVSDLSIFPVEQRVDTPVDLPQASVVRQFHFTLLGLTLLGVRKLPSNFRCVGSIVLVLN